jgi:putative SOS response-associated peptidase YedK
VCGRFTLKTPLGKWLVGLVGQEFADELPTLEPRYNIAPTQSILIAKRRSQGELIQLEFARWGLVPEWSKELRGTAPLINARSETIATKPTFREAFKHGRCAVIADGYYEWQALDKKRKQPFWIHRPDESPFLMAAIAITNRNVDPERPLQTVAIATTASNEHLSSLHDRMPVVLETVDKVQAWLGCSPLPRPDEPGWMQLSPAPNDYFVVRPVSSRVGNPRNEDSHCLDPAPPLWQRTLGIEEPVEPDT